MSRIVKVLTIAGSDSSGGAGIQADIKTFSALGVYAASVLTAVTAQNTCEVRKIIVLDADFVGVQLETVLDDLQIDAIKIGMLGTASVVHAVAAILKRRVNCPIVLDPVMVAKSKDRLLTMDAVVALRDELISLATVVTPNLAEAADLLNTDEPADEVAMSAMLPRLMALGSGAVLLKGGHLNAGDAVDLLGVQGGKQMRLCAARVPTKNCHGTGCTLSAAIAARLALGDPLMDAVQSAKQYVSRSLEQADRLLLGAGHGPLHHFHDMW